MILFNTTVKWGNGYANDAFRKQKGKFFFVSPILSQIQTVNFFQRERGEPGEMEEGKKKKKREEK